MKMCEDVLQKVRLYEEKRGIIYAKTDGKLYKTLKGVYFFAFAYTLVMNILYILGNVFSKTRFDVFKNSVYTVAALSVVMIIALVVMHFKKYLWSHIAAFILNALSSAGLVFVFAGLLEGPIGYLPKFYWRHLVPLCFIVILSLWLTVIAVRAILKTQKTYKKIIENTAEELDEVSENI